MPVFALKGPTRALVAVAVTVALIGAPGAALAAPSGETSASAAKRAQAAQAKAQASMLNADLEDQTARYAQLCADIQRTEQEIVANAGELITLEQELDAAQARFNDRAVIMYQNGRNDLLTLLFASESLDDFVARAELLARASEYDATVLDEVAAAREQSQRMRAYLTGRRELLVRQQQQADDDRIRLQQAIAAKLAESATRAAEATELVEAEQSRQAALGSSGSPPTGSIDLNTIISDPNFIAADSMSATDIQAFLANQPGTLASFTAKDHNGAVKSTAQMVAEAAVAWKISPKVILVTLQKEQSLLSKKSPSSTALDWAMGCGKADSRTYYQYQGFGKQVWFGASKLSKNRSPWKPGDTQDIDGRAVTPTNAGTWSLYRYTPHVEGTSSFWMIYWRYFGNPVG